MDFDNKVILITGGTGSFGKALSAHLLKTYKPKKIIIFSRDEFLQFEMSKEEIYKNKKNFIKVPENFSFNSGQNNKNLTVKQLKNLINKI